MLFKAAIVYFYEGAAVFAFCTVLSPAEGQMAADVPTHDKSRRHKSY